MSEHQKLKDRIFTIFCNHSTDIMYGCWLPLPSTSVHMFFKDLSLYKVRKIIKELVAEGLLESGWDVDYSEEQTYIVRGYFVTEKGTESEIYKQSEAESKRRVKEFGECD